MKNKIIDAVLKEAKIKQANDLPVYTDAVVKSKLYNIVRKYNKIYSDNSWEAITNLHKELNTVVQLATLKTEYDNASPPKYKMWYVVGAFKNPAGKLRAVVGNFTASGAGGIDSPLDRYDINAVLSVVSPRNTPMAAQEYLKTYENQQQNS
jgi:hypothetical protein